ncbi:hypothetical protein N7532_007789 [Penicillium argentinense]|uniref:Uncharacterized protein n=1 Tax=Penicillium argentinense TaxID=1131581 RepID=A0A9W9EWF7_9EURO|nr:uncharacterized protein N7532_007789 [Penicillium argentinense]KAJ5089105.1 hypothetical protein N7532_007789 [Penicillium argentinense]
MVSLSGVVAIAASGAAIFIVFSVVAIVVWVRVRKERHALKVLGLKQGEFSRGLHTFTGNTLTELSNEEGTALRAHGQLPYGKPTEWGQLASRESLLRLKNSSDSSFPLAEKARSLRNSLRRSQSKRLSRSSHKRMSSMATVSEIQQPSPPRPLISKEDIPLSAIEGVLELSAERTPRQTPEMNQDEEGTGFILGMRPVSPGWPLPSQKDRSGPFPVLENRNSQDMFDPPPRVFEESPQRLRGGSITSQRAGTIPEEIPPPPPAAAWPPDRLSYARNDSSMRLSSMSLDTCNSSILDDGRFGPRSADTELTSPIFPSGGTFVPYSANDVGVKNGRRSFIAANTSQGTSPLHNFPVRSSSTAEARRRSSMEPMEPRRSMTTASRNPSNGSDRFGGFPRRTDSVSSNAPQRHSSLRSGTPISMASFQNPTTPNRRSPASQMAYVPHFSQFNHPNIYDEQRENDPFYGGSPQSNGTLFSMGSPSQGGGSMPPSPMQRSSLSLRSSLPSALKGSNSQRKGHRRQNCVRISIHPPMTFGGSTFSPTVEEEPDDLDAMEEVDLRESAINGPAKPPPVLSTNTSPTPLSKRGSRRTKPAASTLGPLAEEPQSVQCDLNSTPSKKRKQSPGSGEANSISGKNHNLPELFTALPPSTGLSLSHTPSPDRTPGGFWSIPEVPSQTYDNASSTGSPRRTAVKGPRTQPGKPARSSSTHHRPKPLDPLMEVSSPTGLSLITGTQGSDWRKSTDSLQRNNTDAGDRSLRRSRELNGSLASGLGTNIDPSSPLYGTRGRSNTVRDRVTIWEDANRSASPPKPPAAHFPGLYTFPESTSPTNKQSIPRSLSRNENSPPRPGGQRMPPTPNSARKGMTTPTGKALGLGIGCTGTPASLYDGDGFLRE